MSPERFAGRLDAWFAGEADDAALAELQAALEDPSHQAAFLARGRLEGALRQTGAAAPALAPVAAPIPFLPIGSALLAAAAALLGLILVQAAPPVQRTVTVRVADTERSWAVATRPIGDPARVADLAITFIPIHHDPRSGASR